MNLCDLEESEVLSITLDQNHLYFEMMVCAEDGATYKLSAWNTAGASLDITFGALNLLGHRTGLSNGHTFGELETVSMVDNVLTLEGDFGDLVLRSISTSIEQME
jgi:hypothetical protein